MAELSQILLTVSGKGGTGKTTVSAGVTSCLAVLGHPTVLVDADIGLRNSDIVLGLTDRALMDFGDVLDGNTPLEDALIAHPLIQNLWVLPAPSRMREIDTGAFAALLTQLRQRFEYIWLDGPAGISEWVLALSGYADRVLVVATQDASSIRDAARMTEVAELAGASRGRLVVNRVRPHLIKRQGSMVIDDIMDETGLQLIGLVPEDERVIVAGNKGLPLIRHSQDGAALAYRNIALRLTGARIPLGDLKVTARAKKEFFSSIQDVL